MVKPFGIYLTPYKVPFHEPENIIIPHAEGRWNYDSVEDFYQSNKILQIRK